MGVAVPVVTWLREQGHDAVHLRDEGLQRLPNGTRLRQLIAAAIVDAHDDSEQRVGFLSILEESLALPFETDMLGVRVTVEQIDLNDAEEVVAICRHGRNRQAVPLVDLPLPS